MSGPKTLSYRMSSARLERASPEAERLRRERLRRLQEVNRQRQQVEQRVARLQQLVREFRRKYPSGRIDLGLPKVSQPAEHDASAIEHYAIELARALDRVTEKLEAARKQATSTKELRDVIAAMIDAASGSVRSITRLTADGVSPSPDPGMSPETKARRDKAQRILARLASAEAEAAPQGLDVIVEEMIAAPSAERAAMLETELRMQVQKHNVRMQRRTDDAREAEQLLAASDDVGVDETSTLRRSLELVILGREMLTRNLRAAVNKEIDVRRTVVQQDQNRRAAEIVRKALVDLGYSTEPISETLFMTGGTVHFQKGEWGEYYVRLRVRPLGPEMNFNVVRQDGGRADDEDQGRRDTEAETEWCRQFGQLRNVLGACGLETTVTRELPVGALAVQRVTPSDVESVLRQKPGRTGSVR